MCFALTGVAHLAGTLCRGEVRVSDTNFAGGAQIRPAISAGSASASLPGAASEFLVDVWRTEQGLPNNAVNALLQTRDGYLWVGTSAGLARFDGIKFTSVSAPHLPSGKSECITALCEDHDGNLWIGTQEGGLLRYREKTLVRFTVENGLLDNNVSNVSEDSSGTLWVGTQSGLNRFRAGRFFEYRSRDGSPLQSISGIHASKSGGLWVTTRSGIYELKEGEFEPLQLGVTVTEGRSIQFVGVYGDRNGNLWGYGDTFLRNLNQGKRYNYFRSTDPSSSRVWTIYERRNGELWVGTKGQGLFCLSNGKFEAAEVSAEVLHNDVRAILEDSEGNLWVGTSGGGLARLKPRRFWLLSGDEGLPGVPLMSLCMDTEARIWVASNGSGIYSGQPRHFKRLRPGGPLDYNNYFWSLCPDATGGLWAGGWGSGLFYWKNGSTTRFGTAEGLSDNVILSVTPAPLGGVWAGTLAGGVHFVTNGQITSYSSADGLSGKPVTCLLVRHNGGIWAGSDGGGLLQYSEGKFVPVFVQGEQQCGVIRTLFEDSADRLWIGTDGGGLACMVHGRTFWCNSSQGLPDDVILQILEDDTGNLWLVSERGISQVAKTGVEKFARGTSRSLPAILCEQEPGLVGIKGGRGWPAVIKTADGKLWFATEKGIAVVDPRNMAPNNTPPPVVIEAALVDEHLVAGLLAPPEKPTPAPPPDASRPLPLTLSPRMHSLDFQYTALSFGAPEGIQFRHKLEGYDQDWVNGGTMRRVHYGKLPAGDYTFRVIARGSDGTWNDEGASLALVVLPPFWRTWWCLSLSGVAVLGMLAGSLRVVMLRRLRRKLERSEQQRTMEKERTRIARDMHDEIGSKLTRISFLSELAKTTPKDCPDGKKQITAIAETSRELLATLDELVWAVNPRNDNLEQLATYLGHYASEYFQMTPVECLVELPAQLGQHALTSELRHDLFLAFQESLNNVLKHAQASRVTIKMRERPGLFEIVINDNGRGFDATRPHSRNNVSGRQSNGLANLKQRLADIGGEFQIASTPSQGTTVSLVLPLSRPAKVESVNKS